MPVDIMTPLCCLAYCRPGFEKETAAELMHLSQVAGIQGYVKASQDTGYVCFYPAPQLAIEQLNTALSFDRMIFARQLIFVSEITQQLPADDRITPLLGSIQALQTRFSQVLLETPDTNDGKQLSGFCKKFSTPLIKAIEKQQLIDSSSPWRLHLFFLSSSEVFIGLSHLKNSSPHAMGIMRLRMPKAAPSRSTLKLEEAFKTMLSEREQQTYLCNGMTAVDLGACPGGWTWQLVNRGIRVIAIDNGPMDQALMDGGLVTHVRADGFTYTPQKTVDWLVCDMVERPMHIARLISRWLTEGHCRHAVFNLKLPMKKRYDMVMECREFIMDELQQVNARAIFRIRQLYHDREEVTCVIIRL